MNPFKNSSEHNFHYKQNGYALKLIILSCQDTYNWTIICGHIKMQKDSPTESENSPNAIDDMQAESGNKWEPKTTCDLR